jgi:hypothetical protein
LFPGCPARHNRETLGLPAEAAVGRRFLFANDAGLSFVMKTVVRNAMGGRWMQAHEIITGPESV